MDKPNEVLVSVAPGEGGFSQSDRFAKLEALLRSLGLIVSRFSREPIVSESTAAIVLVAFPEQRAAQFVQRYYPDIPVYLISETGGEAYEWSENLCVWVTTDECSTEGWMPVGVQHLAP